MPTSATAPQASPRVASELRIVALPNTSAWYSYGIGIRAIWARTAAATSDGSPVTRAATSTLRSTSSWTMAAGSARTVRLATSLRATWPPPGVSISMFPSSVRSLRVCGAPQTTTSKIFDCS